MNHVLLRRNPSGRSRACRTITAVICASSALLGCGGSDDPVPVALLACNDTMKSQFAPDALTTVVAVKSFKAGDPLILTGEATPTTPKATQDLCAVELRVGPGHPGPADAPSTSPGIGIQIWLPSSEKWNQRFHALGGGGWQGTYNTSSSDVAPLMTPWEVAQNEGAVSATTDTGHQDPGGSGSFAMNPDGAINDALWKDFAERGIHEMAVKAKALATAYYGTPPKYSYWDGGSTGGRQGLKEAQVNPADFDGIAAAYPAIHWTKFITAELYPQVVYQRDLGGMALTHAQSDLVSNAAIKACDVVGGQHLGYLLAPDQCRYDPVSDPEVLCTSSGGTNTTAACVSTAQAQVANKIWYGMTSDGSAPSPSVDNGWSLEPSGLQRWYGITRGTSFGSFFGVAMPEAAFSIATQMVALELQDPTLGDAGFRNARGSGQDGWKALSYAALNNAFDQGIALQSRFANINTDDPDLSAFRVRGGKMITVHGLNDEVIFPQGSINYYNRVAQQLGGLSAVQSFYKLYLVPGMGHSTPNGTANPQANPPVPARGQVYKLLTDWVEKGIEPQRVDLQSPSAVPFSKSQPMCPYPQRAVFQSGDPFAASSYICG
ncbi:tannase/feruloyl esterase family alpha/beta hydrolase [Ottowia sp. VDI28]|uniref:tannase/feruloyl esterase family alpha/beta hydrolase n=1 Tax=Ottowia sp. VDI28 TaxID=3133968 RepID=UPI003C2CF47F